MPLVCQARSGSPRLGSSILITSAPKSASCKLTMLPETSRDISITRTPSSGHAALGSKEVRDRGIGGDPFCGLARLQLSASSAGNERAVQNAVGRIPVNREYNREISHSGLLPKNFTSVSNWLEGNSRAEEPRIFCPLIGNLLPLTGKIRELHRRATYRNRPQGYDSFAPE